MAARLHFRAYGDAGLLAGVLGPSHELRWATTQTLAAALRDAEPEWLVDLVATYDHLFVTFDPGRGDHAGVEMLVARLNETLDPSTLEHAEGRTFQVPVLFGGEAGPDLQDVATELHLPVDEVVDRLTSAPWRLRFVASPIGTPFTDRPTWDAAIPRMKVPRTAVPAGSIGLSGSQAIIYPVRSPGGWRLVGRTPLRILDTGADPLVPYRAGDWLDLVAVDRERFEELEARGEPLAAEP